MSSTDTLASSIEKSIIFNIIDKKFFSFKNNIDASEKTNVNYFYSVLTSVFLIVVYLFFGFYTSISILPVFLAVSFILINPLFGIYSLVFAIYFLEINLFYIFISFFTISVFIKIITGKISINGLSDTLGFIIFIVSIVSYFINKDIIYLYFSIGFIIIFLVKACINTFSKFRKFSNFFLCSTAAYLIISVISSKNIISFIPSLMIIMFLSYNVCIFSSRINSDFSAIKYLILLLSSALLFLYGNKISIIVFLILLLCSFSSGNNFNYLPIITLLISISLISIFNLPTVTSITNFSNISFDVLNQKEIIFGITSLKNYSESIIFNGLYNDLPLYKVIFLHFGIAGTVLLLLYILKFFSNSFINIIKHSSENSFIIFLIYCTGLLLSILNTLFLRVDYVSVIQLFLIISLVASSNKIEEYKEEG